MKLKLNHIGIAVKNIDESAAKWKSFFGFKDPVREDMPEREVRVAEFELEAGPTLELVSPLGKETGLASFLQKRGEGIHHLCFEVENIEEAMNYLRKSGARFVNDTPQKGAGGSLIAFIHPQTVNGVLIELKQKRSS